jgi:hypothetical protein
MTHDLPPLPEWPTRLKMAAARDHLTDPIFLRAEINSYATDYARAAIAPYKAEVARLQGGGCARNQGLTQYCAEAATLAQENAKLRELLAEARGEWIKVGYGASHEDVSECRDFCNRIDAALKST